MTAKAQEANRLDAVWSKFFWRVIPLIIVLVIVNFIDRSNLGFAALQMNADLGFSPRVFAFGASIFFIGYLVFQVPANLAIHRFGPRRVIGVIAVLWGIVAASMASIHDERSFYILRALLSVTEAGLMPGVTYYIGQSFPQSSRARAISWLYIATQLAFVIGGPLSGALLELPSLFGLRAWQLMFIIEGVPAILLGFLTLRMLPNRPAEARWLTSEERDLLQSQEVQEERNASKQSLSRVLPALASWRLWLLFFAYICIGANFLSIALWLPQIVRHLQDLRPWQIGVVSAAPYLLTAILMFFIGQDSDRRGIRGPYVVVGTAVGSVGIAASAYFSQSPILSLVALTLGMTAFGSMNGPLWSFATSFLRGPAAAVGIGLISMAGSIGGFLATNILGIFRARFGNFEAGLYVLAGALLLASILVWLATRGERRLNRPAVGETGQAADVPA